MAKRVKKRRAVEITNDNCKQVLLVYRFAGIIPTELSDEEVARRLGLITQGMVDSLMGPYDKNLIKKAESIVLKPIWKSE